MWTKNVNIFIVDPYMVLLDLLFRINYKQFAVDFFGYL